MIHEALYERQNRIQNLHIPSVASVIGCGGTGFWTAVFLAMSGIKELILIDPDKLETSNLNRLPLEERHVGKNKTVIASEFIHTIRNPIRTELHEKRIETTQDCTILRGIVFCCTDNLKSQQIICAYCKKNNLKYQRIGYDGTILNVSKAFPLSFEDAMDEGGYSVTPSWVVPAVFAAAAGVSSKLYKELCIMDDIGKIHTQGCSSVCPKLLDDAREEGEESILENIHDHIPDDYGNCYDCDRINPDDSDYGYCPDCEERYSVDDIAEIKDEARHEGFTQAIEQITNDAIEDAELESALQSWLLNQEVTNAKESIT